MEEKQIQELLHKVKMLENRCFALSQGTLCAFCPYSHDCNALTVNKNAPADTTNIDKGTKETD